MYHQFNIQQFYALSTQFIYVFCVDLGTNSYYFPIQHKLTGFYNPDEKCLLRGTDWVCIYNLGYFWTSNFLTVRKYCMHLVPLLQDDILTPQ